MNQSPDYEKNLERFVDAALRDLPVRRAPRSLEARVRAELERRAALPWWRQSFAHWPMVMRSAFCVLSAGVAASVVAALFLMLRSPAATQAVGDMNTQLAWLELVRIIADSAESLYRAIPPLWLYGTLSLIAACYATLIGVSAAAYRAFSVHH